MSHKTAVTYMHVGSNIDPNLPNYIQEFWALPLQFIPYKEAIALKELGFDELCWGWWEEDKECIVIEKSKNAIQAPTYPQAFRFFRKKYDFNIHEYAVGIPKIIEKCPNGDPLVIKWEYITTESELACLRKMIELGLNTTRAGTRGNVEIGKD